MNIKISMLTVKYNNHFVFITLGWPGDGRAAEPANAPESEALHDQAWDLSNVITLPGPVWTLALP